MLDNEKPSFFSFLQNKEGTCGTRIRYAWRGGTSVLLQCVQWAANQSGILAGDYHLTNR